MKKSLAKFILFIQRNYVGECDTNTLTTFGKIVIYPAYIIRMITIYLLTICLFPLVLIHILHESKISNIIELYREFNSNAEEMMKKKL